MLFQVNYYGFNNLNLDVFACAGDHSPVTLKPELE